VIQILFVCSNRQEKGISPFIKSQLDSLINTGLVNIDLFVIKKRGLSGYISSINQLRKYVKNKKTDIIHAHYGFSGIAARIACPRKKLIVSFLGDDLMGNINLKGHYSTISKLFVFINILFARYFYQFNIVKSENLATKLINRTPYRIIPNGVDIEKFTPVDKEVARKSLKITSEKIVLFGGDPARRVKNFTLAKQSLEIVKLKQKYKLIALKNISFENISFYYNAADLLLLTSFHEGSPNVVKEAMACNCPVISTDVGDVRRLIGNLDGCFIAGFNAAEVASKIENVLKRNKRTAGRNHIIEMGLDNKNIANEIIRIYNEVIKRK
jgi:teichuronic acid biosynthesis glycosyltransferase TuaC